MSETQLLEKLDLLGLQPEYREQVYQALRRAEVKVREADTLLLAVNTIIGELKQPITVISGLSVLSDLLLTEVDRDDPITPDLIAIENQVNRMRETVKNIDDLTRYKTVQ